MWYNTKPDAGLGSHPQAQPRACSVGARHAVPAVGGRAPLAAGRIDAGLDGGVVAPRAGNPRAEL